MIETSALETCRNTMRHHSKSFSLASRLLPPDVRDEVMVLYHWCRRADDAVDMVQGEAQQAALLRLQSELDSIYAGKKQTDPCLAAMQEVVQKHNIPKYYPQELLYGMAMDTAGCRYFTKDELMLYCFRVAGTVGLMMSHVLGVRDSGALKHAAHMGVAMQLSNICRDVLEDWERGRLYLPESLLRKHGIRNLMSQLGTPISTTLREPLASVLRELLKTADAHYRAGDGGLRYLSWRAALAVRTARLVYSRIGDAIAAQHHDIFAGRAHVSTNQKLGLVGLALCHALAETPDRLVRRSADTDFFSKPETLEWIKEQGIELISYRELRHLQREGKPMPRVERYGWD